MLQGKILITFELLTTENFKLNSLDHYQRGQDVKKVYRKQNGEYTLVDCVYTLYISACSSEETIAFYKAMGQKLQIVR